MTSPSAATNTEAQVQRTNNFISFWLIFGIPVAIFSLTLIYNVGLALWEWICDPQRRFYEIALIAAGAPLISTVHLIIASIANILNYFLLVSSALAFIRWRGYVPLWPLVVATPALGWLLWFGYDHFVPDYRWYTDDRPPYEHGITVARFLNAWGIELLVVFGYWWPLRNYDSRTLVAA